MEAEGPCVRIDVSKDQLDVAVRPTGDIWSLPNDASGTTEVVQGLAQLRPKLVVLEATGGLQMPLAAALASAGLPLAMVNPRQVRDFARATGRLAKTDRLDAQVLAHFAEAVRPTPYPLPDAQTQELTAPGRRDAYCGEESAADLTRIGAPASPGPHPLAGAGAGCSGW